MGSRTRAIPKAQEEGYTCDNPQTALSSGAMVGHIALPRSWESLQCLAGGRDTRQMDGEMWPQVPTRKIPTRLWRTFLWWDPSSWRSSTLAWSGHDQPLPSLGPSGGRGWMGGSRCVPSSHLPNSRVPASSQMGEGQQLSTLHSGETQARTPRLS